MRRYIFIPTLALLVVVIAGLAFTSYNQVSAESLRQEPQDDVPTDTFTAVPPTDTNTAIPPTDTNTPIPPTNTLLPSTTATITKTPTVTRTATSTLGAYSRPILTLSGYTYDQNLIYEGGSFTLTSTFENAGQMKAYNIEVTYTSSDFTNNSSGGVDIISSLGASSDVSLSQGFVVNSSISSSPGTITVAVDYKDAYGQSYNQTFTVSINVYYESYTNTPTPTNTTTPVGRPQMVVKSFSVDNATIQPSSTFTLTLDIQNMGTFNAMNVVLNIGGGSTTTFLPINSSNIQAIGSVASQQDFTITQSFMVSSSATGGAYSLPLVFSYNDPSGISYTDTQTITLLIYDIPQVEISFYEALDTLAVGTTTTLPIQIINLGTSSFLFGDLSVTTDNATVANNTAFVGSLDSGASYTQDVDFTPTQSGDYTITVTVKYQDSFNNTQTITKTLSVTVPGNETASGTGVSTGQASTMAVLSQTMAAGGGGGGNFPGGSTTSSSGTGFWNVILRILRGLLGFDSGSSASVSTGPSTTRTSTRATATP